MVRTDRILVVDDERPIAFALSQGLARHGYLTDAAYDGATALRMTQQNPYSLLLLDILMPGMNGLELLREVRQRYPETAVVMMTAVREPSVVVRAMKLGAMDYVLKPCSMDQVLTSVAAALEKRHAKLEMHNYLDDLVERVRRGSESINEKRHELAELLVNVIQSLAYTIEAKDPWTEGHSRKVARLARRLARHLGWDEEAQRHMEFAGVLHDIGMLAVKESVLAKPGPLTFEEYLQVRRHPVTAARILQPIRQFEPLIPAIRHHHEWFDGRGYPDGLAGEDIPLTARVLAIADAYDAIATGRHYREPVPHCEAMEELKRRAGEQFDPALVPAFEAALKEPPTED